MFYAFEVWQTLDQPQRLVAYHIIAGYPTAEAIIELLAESKVAHEFTVSDLQKFFKSNKLTTNEGSMEIEIKPVSLREPSTGKPKTTLTAYRGLKDDLGVGEYRG